MHLRPALWALAALFAVLGASVPPALGAGPPVVVEPAAGVDPSIARRVREVVASRRAIREDLALPPALSVSPERASALLRAASIRLALDRAQKAESEASWDDCVREAAGVMSDAIEVLARVDDLGLLRDLHRQIGVCMTLNQSEANARPHFLAAALLDESPVPPGLHREEAERAEEKARAEVLSRARGEVRIETTPPGAEVWIDGRKAAGTTPLSIDVRLGEHFVTARRFRFDPHTRLLLLQPSGVVKIALDPAQRGTLRDQLALLSASVGPRPSDEEMLLGRATWSRAEQVVVIAKPTASGSLVTLLDAITGRSLHSAFVSPAHSDESFRRAVCDALGEGCEPKARSIPWYVWPISGAALLSGVITAAVIVNNNRDYALCPAKGCH
ncbi:MAG: PEGA domain-containing protein [Byssovorax sp.]